MEDQLFGVKHMDLFLVVGVLIFFIILEVLAGHGKRSNRSFGDWFLELGSYLILALIIKPLIVFIALYAMHSGLPQLGQLVSNNHFFLVLLIYLFTDDLLQYWYHRSAHEYDFLWKLHRPHHQAEQMGFFVSYRNAALYYLMMPNIWWVGIFTFLGGAKAIALGLFLKQFIIISSHSTVSYDRWLNKYPFTRILLSIWERVFITPAFHHAHHGKSKIDGISDPNGNFGNMFSLWDQVFGTAHFNRQFPKEYGLVNDPKEKWSTAYLYPLIKSNKPNSELNPSFQKKDTRKFEATRVQLEANKNYLWCKCGRSSNQAFCDGSHHGTKYKPELFKVDKTACYNLCTCKLTAASPFCDNSHLSKQKE
jgi:sterol desaturase/sphingolipid hydroxylase (fatty acid hydroxylase superfamily)/CDGSH-type Zn-finger protein